MTISANSKRIADVSTNPVGKSSCASGCRVVVNRHAKKKDTADPFGGRSLSRAEARVGETDRGRQ